MKIFSPYEELARPQLAWRRGQLVAAASQLLTPGQTAVCSKIFTPYEELAHPRLAWPRGQLVAAASQLLTPGHTAVFFYNILTI